jgi:hypothetical protein
VVKRQDSGVSCGGRRKQWAPVAALLKWCYTDGAGICCCCCCCCCDVCWLGWDPKVVRLLPVVLLQACRRQQAAYCCTGALVTVADACSLAVATLCIKRMNSKLLMWACRPCRAYWVNSGEGKQYYCCSAQRMPETPGRSHLRCRQPRLAHFYYIYHRISCKQLDRASDTAKVPPTSVSSSKRVQRTAPSVK